MRQKSTGSSGSKRSDSNKYNKGESKREYGADRESYKRTDNQNKSKSYRKDQLSDNNKKSYNSLEKPAFHKTKDEPRNGYFEKRERKTSDNKDIQSFDKVDKRPYKGSPDKPYRENSFKRSPASTNDKPYSGRKSSYDNEKPHYGNSQGERPKRPYHKPEGNSFDKPRSEDSDRPKRPYRKSEGNSFDKPRFEDSDRPKRPYRKSEGSSFDKPRFEDSDRPKRPYRKSEGNSFDKPRLDSDRPKRPYRKSEGNSFDKPRFEDSDRPKRPYRKSEGNSFDKPRFEDSDRPKRPYRKSEGNSFDKPRFENSDRPKRPYRKSEGNSFDKPRFEDSDRPKRPYRKSEGNSFDKPRFEDSDSEAPNKRRQHIPEQEANALMPLNKYIAHSGECSRRDAVDLVKQGKVKVNGELIIDPGYRVTQNDKVTLSGKKLTPTRDKVYILLNKPKGFITTTEDPEGRKTVMDLVANSGVDRLYPVGRLDRNTTGLLLLTNDGDLAQKLSHPSYEIKKIYQVSLDKPLTKADFDKVLEGVQLEDGVANVDALSFLDTKTELGLEIHSGRNRIVRRIFEALGYAVEKLDRVMYAGLTKKNLPRSKWRFLNEREVVLLKHFKS